MSNGIMLVGRRVRIGLLALAASLCLVSGARADEEKGKALFIKHGCWQCHGTLGQGAVSGLRLAPDPIPYEKFANFVRTSNRSMPPYREAILSNDDLAEIYSYLESIPKPPDYKSIPLLNQ
jgi:ubiquinol-cytochrome c reductase cytochrome c subunit